MDDTPISRISRRGLIGAVAIAVAGISLVPVSRTEAVLLSGVAGTVNVDQLNVRTGPASSREVVGRLARGTRVSCVQTSAEWFKITTSSVSGWVHSASITLVPLGQVTTFSRGQTDRKLIALTFDAGADRGYAASILDTLATKGVKASFGMTGQWAKANGDLIRRIRDEGHLMINHTLTHRSMTGVSAGGNIADTPAERLAELMATETALLNAGGRAGKPWFRPPYGDYDASVLRDIAAVGFTYNVMWTVDSLGWNGLSRDQIISRCLGNHGNGYIYLFHVGAAAQDGPALAAIIDGLRARGYGFGTIKHVLGLTTPPPPIEDNSRISISPSSGPPGTTIGVTGADFLANETVGVYWDSTNSLPLAQVTASSSGAFSTSIAAPDDDEGRHLVAAKGLSSGRKASRAYTLDDAPPPAEDTSRIAISPSSGPSGTPISINGSGFQPGETVGLYWDSTYSTALATVTADASGVFSGSVLAQAGAEGRHLVVAKGLASGWKASRSFMLAEAQAAEITTIPEQTETPMPTATATPTPSVTATATPSPVPTMAPDPAGTPV